MRHLPARRTDADCTRREDPAARPVLDGTAVVLIASTRAADGTYEDRTGPLLVQWLRGRGLDPVRKQVVADGPDVGAALRAALAEGADLVITSGGTGISPTDATPEQTAPLLTRPMPGVLEAVRRLGAETTPTALLSRGTAGMAGNSFVVNLPGSRGGVRDGIEVLDPILDHLLDQRAGGGHDAEVVDEVPAAAEPAAEPTATGSAAAGSTAAQDPPMGEACRRVRHAEVSEQEVSVARMASAVADPRCGAIVTFDGVVRDHDEGRGVTHLDYTAHPSADAVMAEVALEVAGRHPEVLLAVAHRHGPLTIGDSALACAVAAPHRKAAFAACDDLVDTVKQRLPIWKHQRFTDGTEEWVGALG